MTAITLDLHPIGTRRWLTWGFTPVREVVIVTAEIEIGDDLGEIGEDLVATARFVRRRYTVKSPDYADRAWRDPANKFSARADHDQLFEDQDTAEAARRATIEESGFVQKDKT